MKVKVLGIKETGKGFNIAHVQLGNLFGDCLAVLEITQPGETPVDTGDHYASLRMTMCPCRTAARPRFARFARMVMYNGQNQGTVKHVPCPAKSLD